DQFSPLYLSLPPSNRVCYCPNKSYGYCQTRSKPPEGCFPHRFYVLQCPLLPYHRPRSVSLHRFQASQKCSEPPRPLSPHRLPARYSEADRLHQNRPILFPTALPSAELHHTAYLPVYRPPDFGCPPHSEYEPSVRSCSWKTNSFHTQEDIWSRRQPTAYRRAHPISDAPERVPFADNSPDRRALLPKSIPGSIHK